MLRGIEMTAEDCAPIRNAVWVTAYGQGFCMRYYLSTAGGTDDVPVVFLNGDRPTFDELHENVRERENPQSNSAEQVSGSKSKDIDTADLAEQAHKISRRTGNTVIYLGRMGVEGSSGHHGLRRTCWSCMSQMQRSRRSSSVTASEDFIFSADLAAQR